MKKNIFMLISFFWVFSLLPNFYDFLNKKRSTDSNVTEFRVMLTSGASPDSYNITPLIGIYANPYQFLRRIAYIAVPPDFFALVLPAQLNRVFIEQTGKNFGDSTKTVYCQIAFYSNIGNPPQTYNLVLHQFLKWFTSQPLPRTNLLMGIFDPKGVRAAVNDSVAVGSVSPQEVNVHNVHSGGENVAYSPNNARFTTLAKREISTFWSIVFSPNNNTILITFNILANTDATTNRLRSIIEQKIKKNGRNIFLVEDLCSFIPALESIARDFTQQVDRTTLQDAVNLLKNSISKDMNEDAAELSFAQCGLQYNFALMDYGLGQLSS